MNNNKLAYQYKHWCKCFGSPPQDWDFDFFSKYFSERNETSSDSTQFSLCSLVIEEGIVEKTDRYNREFLLKDAENNQYKLVYPQDIVFNPMNLRFGAISKSNHNKKVLVSGYYEVLKVRDIGIPEYLSYFMKSSYMFYMYEKIASGSLLEKKRVHLSELKRTAIPVPVKVEQQKISKILSTWDKSINKLEGLISAKQKRKKALMQQLLTGKKRFSGFEGEWKEYKLDQLCQFKKGKGLSKEKLSANGKYKCILYGELYTKYGDVIGNVVSKTDENDSVKSLSGDILIPSSTTTSGIDLANAVALLEDNVLLGGDINILRPNLKMVCSEFLAYLLTHIKKHQIASRAQGITIIHLYGSDLKPLIVKLPNVNEQQKIASVLAVADTEIEINKKELAVLKEQKKGLMQQLLTGKLRVKLEKEH